MSPRILTLRNVINVGYTVIVPFKKLNIRSLKHKVKCKQ